MSFDDTVKDHIFATRFGGSIYTRFNQGQLEGKDWLVTFLQMFSALTYFIDWIWTQLTSMLKLENDLAQEPEPMDPSDEPCWVGPLQDSKSHFESLVKFLNDWYNFMVEQILRVRSSSDVTHRIRRSGLSCKI